MHLDLGVKLRKHRSKFLGIAVAALYVFGPLQLARLIYLTVALLILLERSGGKLRAPNSLTRLLGWWLIWMLPLQFVAAPVYLERFLTFVPLIATIQQHHNQIKLFKTTKSAGVAIAIVLIFQQLSKFLQEHAGVVLSYLGFGYDNSHHLPLFRYVIEEGGLPRFVTSTNSHLPQFLFDYPVGQAAIWGAIATPFRISVSSPEQLIANYMIFTSISVWILICVLCYVTRRLYVSESRISEAFAVFIFVSILVVFGSFGFVVVSGYPPLIAALILLVLGVLIQSETYSRSAFLLQILLVGLIAITYVTFALPAALAMALTQFRVYKRARPANERFELALYGTVVATGIILVYAIFSTTAKSWGWRQILELGGIESAPNRIIVVSILIAVLFAVTNRVNSSFSKNYSMLLIFVWLSYGILAAVTYHFNGDISYYAQKQGYVAILLTAPAGVSLMKFSLNSRKVVVAVLTVSLLGVWSLSQIEQARNPKVFVSGFMSSIPRTVSIVRSPTTRHNQMIDGPQTLRALKEHSKSSLFVMHNKNGSSDLSSRWINALNNSWDDERWGIFLINLEDMRNKETEIRSIALKYPNPVLIVDDFSLVSPDLFEFLVKNKWQVEQIPRS
jgi:hypothetical protein